MYARLQTMGCLGDRGWQEGWGMEETRDTYRLIVFLLNFFASLYKESIPFPLNNFCLILTYSILEGVSKCHNCLVFSGPKLFNNTSKIDKIT